MISRPAAAAAPPTWTVERRAGERPDVGGRQPSLTQDDRPGKLTVMEDSACAGEGRRTVPAAAMVLLLLLPFGCGDDKDDHDAGADADGDVPGDSADDAGADVGEDEAGSDAGEVADAPLMWGPVVRLTRTPADSETFLNTAKCVAADDAGTIHVAWLEVAVPAGGGHAAQGQVFYTRSTDGGSTFATPTPLTEVVADVGVPKIAVAGASVFVTWHQSNGFRVRIRLARSADGGATWAPATADLGQGTFPSIDAWSPGSGDPFVHVAWSDSQNAENHCEVYLASSADGGRSFGAPVMVSEPDGRSSWTAAVASWDRTVHVAWTDERHNIDAAGEPYDCIVAGGGETCHEEEYYRRSRDGGATFPEPEVRLTSDPPAAPQWSWAPSIVAWYDDVHIAYFDHRSGSFEIYYRRSRDAGTTWEEERNLTGALPAAPLGRWRPSLAAAGDRLRIAFWEPAPGGPTTAWTIGSDDGGGTWWAPRRLTDGVAPIHPAVALSPEGTAHFAWYDTLDGNHEMFYRHLAP